MNCFIINNITEGDVKDRLLRILDNNKKYFPILDDGNLHSYDVTIKVGAKIYNRKYSYYKDKSGRLYLGANLCKDILQIKHRDILVVVVLEENRFYQIINLNTLT